MTTPISVEVLSGGASHHGKVVRIGGTVRRPMGSWSTAVHALLLHLEAQGFPGAPRVLGVDGDYELLSFIPGRTPALPPPQWSRTDQAATSVASLLRSYHDAVLEFDFHRWTNWADFVPKPYRAGGILGHNDTVRSNVVFSEKDCTAIALIDFDRAAPSSVVYELAVAASQWIPLRGEEDDDDTASGLRTSNRLRKFLDDYGVDDSAQRSEILAAIEDNEERNRTTLTDLARSGHPAYRAMVEGGALDRIASRQAFLARHHSTLSNALL